MKRLYAPWRHDYVTGMTEKKGDPKNVTPKECVFCTQIGQNDDDNFYILKRYKHCVVMMNYYPYNVGHVMVLPYEHKGELHDLTPEVRADMMEAVTNAIQVTGRVLKSGGCNVGINLGLAGGGGIPSHLHIHVLPRWRGDTNFLETIGEVKLQSADFEQTFKNLQAGFNE